ncbi:MAG: YncE family protein, partial [Dehalococcoidia bacterium]
MMQSCMGMMNMMQMMQSMQMMQMNMMQMMQSMQGQMMEPMPAPGLQQQTRLIPGASGTVYTADELGQSISAIDLASGTVEAVPVPISPHNVQVTADGSVLLAVGEPAMSVHGADANEAHAASEGEGLLVVLDPFDLSAGPLASIAVGEHPAHVVVDQTGRYAFVSLSGEDAVAVVDLEAHVVDRTIKTGAYPHGLRISPDGGTIYVANVEGDSVSVIETATFAEVARLPVGDAPVQVGFTPDGNEVFVSLRDEDRVAVIDTTTREVTSRIAVGPNPIQVH